MNLSDFEVKSLGKCTVKSPLNDLKISGEAAFEFVTDEDRVLHDLSLKEFLHYKETGDTPLSFEVAGPREYIYFEPAKTKVAIVTCGGLCPGLNNVIRSLVFHLYYRYKVRRIIGIKFGYAGFIPSFNLSVVELNPDLVDNIHTAGGTMLGSSRGNQDVSEIVDTLEKMNINILFTVGGDGTQRGAYAIHEEITKRGLKIAVAGIPKTIDNDISYIERSFGFDTAVSTATTILRDAHNEAKGAYNGIAIVKLMGRDSGFIAASAALSVPEVNFVLIPEMKFDLYGKHGFLEVLKKRLRDKNHALIVVAEGAGKEFFEGKTFEKDASGNVLNGDIGVYLKEKIEEELKKDNFPFVMKYIDPSYIIRSVPANANDSKFCSQLTQNAVHATMAGKTAFVAGYWNGMFTLLPIPAAVKERKKINLESELWLNVLEATGQPNSMRD